MEMVVSCTVRFDLGCHAGYSSFGKEGVQDAMVPKISQATLAAMVGCTRSRVNFFLNRFRKLGFIEYDQQICVKRALMQVVLHDWHD